MPFNNLPPLQFTQIQTQEVFYDPLDGLSHDDKITKIREWFTETETFPNGHLSSVLSNGSVSYYSVDQMYKKIHMEPGLTDSEAYYGSDYLNADYYYYDGVLYFVFLYNSNEEYRFYLENFPDGMMCIRYIDTNRNQSDFESGISLSELDSAFADYCGYGIGLS